ncbi:MAG: IS630 family transposase [Gemmatimonadaceae bacterium]|nr:IS630 family transposase [Gemmatimonadaceae bacterium]
MWCLATLDAEYLARMEDVLALYERPLDPTQPVVCLDEKPVSLHADVRAPRSAHPGHVAKRDNEYRRCGTANIFGVVEPKAGRHFTCATPNRSAAAFARMVRRVIAAYPDAHTIHLVLDNLNTHREKALRDHFGPAEGARLWARLTVHYTPKHGSWLNQAEIALSLVSRQCLGSQRIAQLPALQRQVRAWTARANRRHTTIAWRFSRKGTRQTFGYEKPRL